MAICIKKKVLLSRHKIRSNSILSQQGYMPKDIKSYTPASVGVFLQKILCAKDNLKFLFIFLFFMQFVIQTVITE